MGAKQLQSVIASVRQWQREGFGSKGHSAASPIPVGSGSGLARATDKAAVAQDLADEDC